MYRYRRLKIEGGAFFFTLALAGLGDDLRSLRALGFLDGLYAGLL